MDTIVYRELSSLERDLGYPAKTLYAIANTVASHYQKIRIPKGSGGIRTLRVPDPELKILQKRIANVILSSSPVSLYAAAYRPGGSPKRNAAPHAGHRILLKLDIRHFFDGITYYLIKEKAFPADRFSESNRILLSFLCCDGDCLPQGAPTSPVISNIILRELDEAVGSFCQKNRIVYTRYCDDMTFSGDFDPAPVKTLVRNELGKLGLFLNDKKTGIFRNGQRKTVTGIVVNEKLRIPADRKHTLRQEMYFCMKYGIRDHLLHQQSEEDAGLYAEKLLGKVNYVLFVEPQNPEFARYREWLLQTVRRKNTSL